MAKDKKKNPVKTILYSKEQTDFVRFYIENRLRNAGESYQKAYPNCKSDDVANSSASRLLRTAKIQALLCKMIEEATGGLKEHLDYKLINMWVTRAMYDVADILDDDGSLARPMSELKRMGLSVCIDGIDIKPDKDGGEHRTYKLADREKSLDQLQKLIGLIKPLPTLNMNINQDVDKMTAEEEALYKAQLDAIRGKGK